MANLHRGRRTIVHASAFLTLVGLVLGMGVAPALADGRGGPPAEQRAAKGPSDGQRNDAAAQQKGGRAPTRASAAPGQAKKTETNQSYAWEDEGSAPHPHGKAERGKGEKEQPHRPGPKHDDVSPAEGPTNVPAATDEAPEPTATGSSAPTTSAAVAPRPSAVRALSNGQVVTAGVGSVVASGTGATTLAPPVAPPVAPEGSDPQAPPAADSLLGALAPSPALPFLPALDNPAFPVLLLAAIGLFLVVFGRGDRRDPKLVEAVVDDHAQDVDFS